MFTNVMWATDGSEHANRALPYATQIAKENGANLHAVHVIEHLVGARIAGQLARIDEPELDERIKRQIADHDRAAHTHTTVHMIHGETGNIAKRIAALAEENDVDLIVIGTHGRGPMAGAVIGSVAQRLLHHASCPVLAVSPKAARDDRVGPTSVTSEAG